MILNGVVLEVRPAGLLVREFGNGQEVMVNTRDTRNFSRGDCVRVTFRGMMTPSVPPQITALQIHRTHCRQPIPPIPLPPVPLPPVPPSGGRQDSVTAVVLERRRGALLVRDIRNNRTMLVLTPHSNHFCPQQRIHVVFDSITLSNPPEVRAIEIEAVC